MTQQYAKKKSGGKLQFAFNLLKSTKAETSEDENGEDPSNLDDSIGDTENGDTKSRISLRSAAGKINYYRQRQSLSAEVASNELPYEKAVDNALITSYLPPKKMVNVKEVREGARRFAFLLETSKPGELPDAPLMAALGSLRSPVISRAILLLECSHFVYKCNRGEWPEWIRNSNIQSRAPNSVSFTSSASRFQVTGSRKVFMLQRAAGRNFYNWAIHIGARLQKALEKETLSPPSTDEERRRLKMFDDLEDFLDDGTVNDSSGENCPIALHLMGCMLLFQITSFLRETFQLIPRTKFAQKSAATTAGWDKLMTHRRWSILSNTFNQQSGSVHSINELHPNVQTERRVSYSTADEESSPRGSHDMVDELPGSMDKKGRRLAQGRQRLLKRGSPSGATASDYHSRKSSFRLRKQSRSPAGAIDADEPSGEAAPLVSPSGSSFSQRRRKTTSLKSIGRWHMSSMRLKSPGAVSQQAAANLFASLEGAKKTDLDARPGSGKRVQTVEDDCQTAASPTGGEQQFSPERRSNMGSYSSTTHPPISISGVLNMEEDEEEMFKTMPWLKVLVCAETGVDHRI
ncbi:UNC-80 protein [Aphelenchoides avenae]|nr:UNC-80 protein [Aphelenchus avenae]